jgi:hypothetical protein
MFSRRLKGGGTLTYFTATGFGVGLCSRVPAARRFAPFAALARVDDDLAFFMAHPPLLTQASDVCSALLPQHIDKTGRSLPFEIPTTARAIPGD